MKWEHKCSLDWLIERQMYLTASDVRSLVPYTRTGRKRDVTEQEFLKVWAEKDMTLTEEDCMSYGAAARGHILEPYAIDALNGMLVEVQGEEDHELFYWWDDKLIHEPGRRLAFSPDAMDVPMGGGHGSPTAIAEVKSYAPAKHMATAYAQKDMIEERWQIATAMAACETIDHAYLVLFNPAMGTRRTFVIRFYRDELEEEIRAVLEVERQWNDFLVGGCIRKPLPSGGWWKRTDLTEGEIALEVESRQRLNPM